MVECIKDKSESQIRAKKALENLCGGTSNDILARTANFQGSN